MTTVLGSAVPGFYVSWILSHEHRMWDACGEAVLETLVVAALTALLYSMFRLVEAAGDYIG